jgi:signal peptidase I
MKAAIGLIAVSTLVLIFLQNRRDFSSSGRLTGKESLLCVSERKTVTVRGTSMEPLYSPGRELTELVGYYQCNSPQKGEIVIYRHPSFPDGIVKRVVAVGGDSWKYQDGKIWVNGHSVKNSAGEIYRIENSKMLELAASSYPVLQPGFLDSRGQRRAVKRFARRRYRQSVGFTGTSC